MKVSVAVRVPAKKRRHTPVSVSSEEFIKGTSYKGAGRTWSHLPGEGAGERSVTGYESGRNPGQRVRVPNFISRSRSGAGAGGVE